MLGLRGVRLGIRQPEILQMQVRAIFEAACDVTTGRASPAGDHDPADQRRQRAGKARGGGGERGTAVLEEQGIEIEYQVGTMVETPRAALTADRIAEHAEFFSFGTNDLTQTTFGISRDDAEAGFLLTTCAPGVYEQTPSPPSTPTG